MLQGTELIEKIAGFFMRYGIKSVTMSDLSRELGVSKKTLYQHFSDKKDLVRKVVRSMIDSQKCGIDQMLAEENHNAIDQLFSMSRFIADHIKTVNPVMYYDLKKAYPEIWAEVLAFKRRTIFDHIMGNIARGIREGLYLSDLNYEIIAMAYVSRLEMYARREVEGMDKFSFGEVFHTLFIYHVRGISNEKGTKYLEGLMARQDIPSRA